MANTLSTYALRHKYFQSNLQPALRNALVSEKVFKTDHSDLKTIENPYMTQPTATIQAVAGTYSPNATVVTDDALSVNDEVIAATHIFDFEMRTANFNLISDFLDDLMYVVAQKTDQFALNKVLSQATGAYTTPAGGFGTSANIPVIMSNLLAKVAGFQSGTATSPFIVIENTDIPGFAQAQVASGFSYADAALKNGFMTNYMGVEVYVVRSGTFTTSTLGTLVATNSGHRLFGMGNMALFASPRGIQYEEKAVTGKTGKEVVAWGYTAAKVWTPQASLFVNVTLA